MTRTSFLLHCTLFLAMISCFSECRCRRRQREISRCVSECGRWDYSLVHVQTVRNSPKSSHDFLVIPSVILRLNKRLEYQRPPNQYFVQFTGCDARTIGLTVSASDSKHRGFDPFRSIRNNIGQVVHTVPLSPSRINRYQSRGGEASRLGR